MAGYLLPGYGMQLTAEQQQQYLQQYQQQLQQHQQQLQQQQPAQQQAAQGGTLAVTGCTDATVGNIVRGTFSHQTENHGRPVYKKNEPVANNPTLDVLIYFWDERDGANFCGWWFGPKVGGDQVWAYNSERSATPPATGWRVPYDGQIDPSFAITAGTASSYAAIQGYGQYGQYSQQVQQQQMQQQLQQQQLLKQREEEQRRQEQQRRAEQQGVVNCQQILQKLTQVTPENVVQLKDEVEKLVMQELPKCGSQAEVVKAEAMQQLQMAHVRVEQIKHQRIEEERQNMERSEEAKRVLAELSTLVEKAEEDTAQLKSVAAPVLESKILSEEDARTAGKAVSEVSVAAKASCKACSDFVVERRMGLDAVKPPLLNALREEQLKLQSRIQECYKIVVSSTISAKVMIDKAVKKTVAEKVLEKRTSCFQTYTTSDRMSVDQIVAYAKGEYSFALSKEAAQAIAKKHGDAKSVAKAQWQRVKVAVGIAREEEASKMRLKEAEEKRLAMEAEKKAMAEEVEKVLTSRKYLSVAAESVLTDEVKLEEGKTIRRLELKELLEVLEGPVEEETSKLPRVRCRTVYDRLEGWVTVTGNNGTEYLVPSEGLLEVLREVALTEGLMEGNLLRPLACGEKLEVIEWDQKGPTEEIRVKVRVKGAADIGWATRASADGTQFMKLQ